MKRLEREESTYRTNLDEVKDILDSGAKRVKSIAREKLLKVRDAVGIV